MSYDPIQFAKKYQLALQTAQQTAGSGLCGLELEWNLLDQNFQPLRLVGNGAAQQSFVDYLRAECLAAWSQPYSQLEVFHWMIEWATRPYFHPRGTIYEARLIEAALLNALHKAGRQLDRRLYIWPGNLPLLPTIDHDSIPGSWHLAKRLYLQRCVDLYGSALATAGTHTNLSLPDPLLAWDFMHTPPGQRFSLHFDEFKSEFYITATRLIRAFAALFIATSAATPFQGVLRDGKPVALLTCYDSVRNLTFPNPPTLDLPNLYRSYDDYLHLSYDLVRRGVRFGNNNWTPTRARSSAEPVERLIAVTSEQLKDLYARGLYAGAPDQTATVAEMAQQIEQQNLLARINLPMMRVEVRTDDGGHPLEVEIANLTLKHLLLLRFYADPEFGRAFRYDAEDIARARRNEDAAARDGLRSAIEHPLTGKPMTMRAFLSWTLQELRPLAEALGMAGELAPLEAMAGGAPNTAERLREAVCEKLGVSPESLDQGALETPLELMQDIAATREARLQDDLKTILTGYPDQLGDQRPMDAARLAELIQQVRDDARHDPYLPYPMRACPPPRVVETFPDTTSEILELAQALIRIPSVTACPQERLKEVHQAAGLIHDTACGHGLNVRFFGGYRYPAVLVGFPGQEIAPVMLSGHFDVVAPDPDERQFEPRIDGDYLWGRGAADMKTVVATYLVWMKDRLRQGPPYPPINLLLVGNEENGETEPMGTPHVLGRLANEQRLPDGTPFGAPYIPRLFIAGERTGERGDELWGEVCTQNRGVMRCEVVARAARQHSGVGAATGDLTDRLMAARVQLQDLFARHLTLQSNRRSFPGWQTQARFPFIQVGEPGVYNVTPGEGRLGIEIRSIPQDDLGLLHKAMQAACAKLGLELQVSVMENGVVCNPDNPYLQALLHSLESVSGQPPVIGRKLPGTSARFAPDGQGVVWGQTGIGPHGPDERHYIPSILPYYQALDAFAQRLISEE